MQTFGLIAKAAMIQCRISDFNKRSRETLQAHTTLNSCERTAAGVCGFVKYFRRVTTTPIIAIRNYNVL